MVIKVKLTILSAVSQIRRLCKVKTWFCHLLVLDQSSHTFLQPNSEEEHREKIMQLKERKRKHTSTTCSSIEEQFDLLIYLTLSSIFLLRQAKIQILECGKCHTTWFFLTVLPICSSTFTRNISLPRLAEGFNYQRWCLQTQFYSTQQLTILSFSGMKSSLDAIFYIPSLLLLTCYDLEPYLCFISHKLRTTERGRK